MEGQRNLERIQTVIIGGGQSGLSVGYHLARRGLPFVILDANVARRGLVASSLGFAAALHACPIQRTRRLGRSRPRPTRSRQRMKWPTTSSRTPRRFSLPVRSGTRVTKVSKRGGAFIVDTDAGAIEADQVVVAMATYQAPTIPAFARDLDPAIVQIHSREYRNPGQLRPGGVLLVGAGNSGAEIAIEVARTHRTWMSGRDVGRGPFPHQQLGRPASARAVRPESGVPSHPDGEHATRPKSPAGCPVARRSAHSDQAGQSRGRRCRARGSSDRRNGRPPCPRGRSRDERRRQRDLVHRVSRRLRLDRSTRARRARRAATRARAGPQRTGPLLRRPAFPVRVFVHDDSRRRQGCQPRGRRDC